MSRRAKKAPPKKRDQDRTLGRYLKEIGETPLLTREEESALAKLARQGDQEALERLTRSNLRFVVSVAKQYQNQGLSLADLISEGNIGLMKAAKRFDESRNFKFISYAVWWVRQSILQALADQSRIVRVPLNQVGTLHKIGKVQQELSQEFGRTPSNEELAEEMAVSTDEIDEALKISNNYLSLDAPFAEGESNTLKDVLPDNEQIPPDDTLVKEALREEIRKALGTLSEREAEVLILYYGIDRENSLTLEEIGYRFGLTRERVRQIKEKALKRLRTANRARNLRAFLTP
jgi:RNA polymerase primary sigma factor